MKQKLVIKVCLNGKKSRSKAMKIVVGISGVESAALQGADKNQIEVTGDGVDAVVLTTALRKNVGYAELVSVTAVGEKKPEPRKIEANVVQPPLIRTPCYQYPPCRMIYEYWEYPDQDPICSIM
ncbi:heavy metal-associated isoprenylated plant protein 16-like [Cornus florida]|uniref:heavy metal-associated isoprenylated plant protein 16-like n=1 Tax=Cornus florida TaxID=4283 RepID=UPI002899DCC2|nr:heavy metal-associated isoprenylated plant protein 16-like [Cornus florida]